MTVSYVPLTHAIGASDARVNAALTALSFAEIRSDVTTKQLVDTVNELHDAVGQGIELARLFMTEVEAKRRDLEEARKRVSELVAKRTTSADSSAHRDLTLQIFDLVRLCRTLTPPSIASASLVIPAGRVTPGDVTPGDVTPGDVTPGDVITGDVTPDDVTPAESAHVTVKKRHKAIHKRKRTKGALL